VGVSGKGCWFNFPWLDFDRRLLLQFRGSAITSGAGVLPTASWMTPWV
jgi:hypothetical protein